MTLHFAFLVFLASAVSDVSAATAKALGCATLKLPCFSEFTILSAHAVEVRNYSSPLGDSTTLLNYCKLSVSLTHSGANDTVRNEIWLPLDNWNGRFQATGGGGLLAGTFQYAMFDPAAEGYATGSTDAGLSLNGTIYNPGTGAWALKGDGSLNYELIENFAHRSIHDMTVLGKAAITAFYGQKALYTYYNGCSTGGRQGYFAAQKHPEDFDGILAYSPALFTPQVSPADFWPTVVMENVVAPPQCVFEAYQSAIISECDLLDGAPDGLISSPEKCRFDSQILVGTNVSCADTGSIVQITPQHAVVVEKILQGPRDAANSPLWYGLAPGASFDGLANTTVTGSGEIVPVPFSAADAWIKYFIAQDSNYSDTDISFATFQSLFQKSVELFERSLGLDNANLTGFQKAKGKLLSWHGLADEYVSPQGSLRYWNTVRKHVDSDLELAGFYRLFLAPGVAHCSGGYGPFPVDAFAQLRAWVENGTAPETLFAEITVNDTGITRNLCAYPKALQYNHTQDVNLAASFSCS